MNTQIEQAPPLAENEDAPSLTIRQFCELENMSTPTFYKLQRLGLGPDVLRIPGLSYQRITMTARREWRERMEDLRKSQAVEIERQRRAEQTRVAGTIAAASPRHNCRRARRTTAVG